MCWLFLADPEWEAEAKTRRAGGHYLRPDLTELMAPGAMVWLPRQVAEEVWVRVLWSLNLSICDGIEWHVHCHIHFLIREPGTIISLDDNLKKRMFHCLTKEVTEASSQGYRTD